VIYLLPEKSFVLQTKYKHYFFESREHKKMKLYHWSMI